MTTVHVNGGGALDVTSAQVVSTLPPGVLVRLLDPPAPREVIAASTGLKFRCVVLVTVFIDRPTLTPNATIYFPDPDYPFSRVSEPRNRSPFMAPAGQTSLSIEIPCWHGDTTWNEPDGALIQRCCGLLESSILPRGAAIGGVVHRLPFAYPVLDLEADDRIACVERYLERFENLKLLGRSARFAYVHLHDLLEAGRQLVDEVGPVMRTALPTAATMS
jgi:protoporphyrinogen oxidase